MPLVMNEQEEKKEGLYLTYQGGKNTLLIKSNLYKITAHYVRDQKTSVICAGETCVFCKNGYQKKAEYHYYVKLNNQLGMVDIKPSVFFAIQDHAKTLEAEPRKVKWIVTKKGEGLKTEYVVTPIGQITEDEYEQTEKQIEEYNQKLTKAMEGRENWLNQKYTELQAIAVPQAGEQHEKETSPEPNSAAEEAIGVDPDDIPF